MAEYLDIFDETGKKVGCALRSECHGNPLLLHRTSHVVVFHPEDGKLLLQKRTMNKDIQPGKWDTAVGGHLAPGESFESGAIRELEEELGLNGVEHLELLTYSSIRNEIESEDVAIFILKSAGPFAFDPNEISEIRFWSSQELFDPENQREFTPNLCCELELLHQLGRLSK